MKFVIHHHTGNPCEEAHYDVMIESIDALFTWRITESAMKDLLEGKEVSSTRISDHRKVYLTYEGPISCDRGMVRIMDSGSCTPLYEDNTILRYAIMGNIFCGTLTIQKRSGATSIFCYMPSNTEKMR